MLFYNCHKYNCRISAQKAMKICLPKGCDGLYKSFRAKKTKDKTFYYQNYKKEENAKSN